MRLNNTVLSEAMHSHRRELWHAGGRDRIFQIFSDSPWKRSPVLGHCPPFVPGLELRDAFMSKHGNACLSLAGDTDTSMGEIQGSEHPLFHTAGGLDLSP